MPPRAAKDEAAQRPRLETLAPGSPWRAYPPLEDADGLLEWLADAGWCQWGDYGAQGLSWSEWEAWQRMTGAEVIGWRARLLFSLSHHYAAAANLARDPAALSSWDPDELPSEADLARRRSAVKDALRGGRVSPAGAGDDDDR